MAGKMLFGMGNPLLDISAEVDDKFLEKYKLKANDAILASKEHLPIYKEIVENYQVDYIAGGATQNSLRVIEWIIRHSTKSNGATIFMGAVGNDDYGKILKDEATKNGVNVQYQIVAQEPTGTCAVLLTHMHRSLCANLGAANCFTEDHLIKNFNCVESADFYYISGFFLTVSPESIARVGKYANEKNRPFMMNLSAPFISQVFTDRLMSVLPYVDILFGNESEAEAFAEVQNYGTKDVAQVAVNILKKIPKNNKKRNRMVVFTQGPGDVIVATEPDKVQKFPVPPLQKDKIVDTNGAGDAFVGGFLSQMIQGKDIEVCVKSGNWAAAKIIAQQGCTFPKDVKFPDFITAHS